MTTKFTDYLGSVADEIITLSEQLGSEIETWQDVFARVPNSSSKGVTTGFTSKPAAPSRIEIVVDVQAPPAAQTAHLRIWAIQTSKDNEDNERFDNIQLTYSIEHETGRALVSQQYTPGRDVFSRLVHDSANRIESLVVSDLTGKGAASDEPLGKRYDLTADELNSLTEDRRSELMAAMITVLKRLKVSAGTK